MDSSVCRTYFGVVAGGRAGAVAGSVSGAGGVVLPGPVSGVAGVTGAGITCGAELGLGAVSGRGASAGFLQADRLTSKAAANRAGIFMMFPLQESKDRDAGGRRCARSLNLLQWRLRFCSLFHFAPRMGAHGSHTGILDVIFRCHARNDSVGQYFSLSCF